MYWLLTGFSKFSPTKSHFFIFMNLINLCSRDRVGTVVNVVGDAYIAGVIGHVSKKDLEKVPIQTNPDEPSTANKSD